MDISNHSTKLFFNVDNLKPGDWTTSQLIIKNSQQSTRKYTMFVKQNSGSELLFNQLHLTIKDSSSTIYDGKLSQFNGFDNRSLSASETETLDFEVKFPYESGNEFQGLGTDVVFQFLAEADPAPGTTPDQDTNPGSTPVSSGHAETPQVQPVFASGGLLPQTGQGVPYLYYIIGGLLLAAGGSLFIKSRFVQKL
ncbi:LPXTG cell wall anchor domain-containing protein [Halobacillus salinarum]|uniref:LPXTG cell wall anchor domain-containing protein n=1 Tax=Halobacillus salinarum TaxID=2932257 RepID=A0ABY4EKN4_9BACI|nr:LPXTG cell wall anchor domain-containing protein [Halobacillus salinarum]UOQ44540.1 LPXTG cell wall anchor domain-containing protein [Halobacillus salinarum]